MDVNKSVIGDGTRKEALEEMRRELADFLTGTRSARDIAAVSKELREVMKELEEIASENPEVVSDVDELANRRNSRRQSAS